MIKGDIRNYYHCRMMMWLVVKERGDGESHDDEMGEGGRRDGEGKGKGVVMGWKTTGCGTMIKDVEPHPGGDKA